MFPAWFGGPDNRARHRCNCAQWCNVFGDRRAGLHRAGDRRIPGRARRQASGADQPARARAMPRNSASTRLANSTAANSGSSLPTSRTRTTSHACWRPPCRRATAVGRHRPCRGRAGHHPAERPGRRRSGSRLLRKGLGCLAFERSSRRPEAGLLHQHLLDRLGVGRVSVRPPTARPTPSSTGWPGACASRASPGSASTSVRGRPAWPTRSRLRDWSKRGVRTLSPADALAGLADVVAAASAHGPAQGVVARIDWARFLPLYQQAGRRAFLAELEREVPTAADGRGAVDDWLRKDPACRATRQCSCSAAQEAADGLPARRGSRGDACRCRRDPRGRGVLRPRHGFADGGRIAATPRARVWARRSRSPW